MGFTSKIITILGAAIMIHSGLLAFQRKRQLLYKLMRD